MVPSLLEILQASYMSSLKLHKQFALKQLGELDYFLGIEVRKQPSGSILLTQTKYITDLLHKTMMHDSNYISTPMPATLKFSKVGSPPFDNPTLLRSVVGALQYATITRPELSPELSF